MPIDAKKIVVKGRDGSGLVGPVFDAPKAPDWKPEVYGVQPKPEPEPVKKVQSSQPKSKDEVKQGLFAHKSSKFLDDMLKKS